MTPRVPPGSAHGIALVFGALAVAGCATTAARHAWLTTFLDGVPSLTPTNQLVAAQVVDPVPPPDLRTEGLRRSVPGEPTASTATVHVPYGQRECEQCHSARFSHALRVPKEELCQGCHSRTTTDARVVHAPAGSGECLACHHPHAAELPSLLVQKLPDLCFQCHDVELLSPIAQHRDPRRLACSPCHDPHASDQHYLLRTARAVAGPGPELLPLPAPTPTPTSGPSRRS